MFDGVMNWRGICQSGVRGMSVVENEETISSK